MDPRPPTPTRGPDLTRAGLDLGPEFNARYSVDDPTNTYENSDISPNFPYASQIWAKMWEKQTGQKIKSLLSASTLDTLARFWGSAGLAARAAANRRSGSNAASAGKVSAAVR